MARPTLTESMRAAELHLVAALECLRDARDSEQAEQVSATGPGLEERRKTHALAVRSLARAEQSTRDALEVVAC